MKLKLVVMVALVLLETLHISFSAADDRDHFESTCDQAVPGFNCLSTVTCEGDSGVLRCDVGRIQVTSASFGRTDRETCSRGRPLKQLRNTNCVSNVLPTVSQSCNGQQHCEGSATTAVFSDPCPGTYKYLSVSYYCVPPEIQSSITCEGAVAALSCGSGLVLHILSANFGRTDLTTCLQGRGPITKTNCYGPDSMTVVSAGCEGKNSCSLSVSGTTFHDACLDTYEYLYVSYTCVGAAAPATGI